MDASFGITRGRVWARDTESNAGLRFLSSAARDYAKTIELPNVVIRHGSGRRPTLVQPVAVRGIGLDMLPGARIVLMLTDLGRDAGIDTTDLRALFQLSSAEAEVAALMARGLGVHEIAEHRGVARETMRVQLKSLFRKMDANRQSDLVRLVDRISRTARDQAQGSPGAGETTPEPARKIIAAMSDRDKTDLLTQLFEGDAHARAQLRLLVRQRLPPDDKRRPQARTASELRARVLAIRDARERAAAKGAAAERLRLQEEADRARRERLVAIAQRGESVWREIEAEIERRNAGGYDRATGLLADLRQIAGDRDETEAFTRRLQALRERHAKKARFIERLASIGQQTEFGEERSSWTPFPPEPG